MAQPTEGMIVRVEDVDGNEEATCTWHEFQRDNPEGWQDVARQWASGERRALIGWSFVSVIG